MDHAARLARLILWLAALGLAILLTGRVVDQVRGQVAK